MVLTVVFEPVGTDPRRRGRTEIAQSMAIVAEAAEKKFGRISLENQQRNFLTGFVTENPVTKGNFASNFMMLYDQETIEWE